MGKRSRSKRFVQHGRDAIEKHAEQFPYRMTYAEAEARKMANEASSDKGGL